MTYPEVGKVGHGGDGMNQEVDPSAFRKPKLYPHFEYIKCRPLRLMRGVASIFSRGAVAFNRNDWDQQDAGSL